jgi:hypothetical protein
MRIVRAASVLVLVATTLSISTWPQPALAKKHEKHEKHEKQHDKRIGLVNTTVFIIRHADKPESGPDLSAEGQQRAKHYVDYFAHHQLDGQPVKLEHIFATAPSKESDRPRETVTPLAQALGLSVDDRYSNKQVDELAKSLRKEDHGRQILICWHHGEIPRLLEALGADPETLLHHGKWPGDVFGWLITLRFDAEGELLANESSRVDTDAETH